MLRKLCSNSAVKWIIQFSFLSLFLFFSACGKNDPIVPTGTSGPYNPNYYPQAPVPPNGGYYPPPGGYQGGNPPYFNPTLPPGMPPQYTPWLPIDNYFRQNPQTVNVWVNIWVNWQNYAQYQGYDVYDFPRFWFDYCPSQLGGTQFAPVYNYFDQNVYYWVDYNTQFYCEDPSYFWQYYQGMPYGDVCGGSCW